MSETQFKVVIEQFDPQDPTSKFIATLSKVEDEGSDVLLSDDGPSPLVALANLVELATANNRQLNLAEFITDPNEA